MPEYLAPGVYIEETSFRSKSIEGVSTSTAAFVGPARYGPISGDPELITSLTDFERIYGGLDNLQFTAQPSQTNFLAHGVRAFFEEGGKRLYVSRIFNNKDGGGVAQNPPAHYASADNTGLNPVPPNVATLRARFPGSAGNMRVTFTLQLGANAFNLIKPSGGGAAVPQLSRIQDYDVVYIGKGTPLAALRGDGLFLARWDNLTRNWLFKGDGADLPLSDASLNDPTTQVLPVTVLVEVERPLVNTNGFDFPIQLGVFDFDPRSPTGLTAMFQAKPVNRIDMLTVPFAVDYPPALNPAANLEQLPLDIARDLMGGTVIGTLNNNKTPIAQRRTIYTLQGGDDGAVPEAANYEGDPDNFHDFVNDNLQLPKNGLLAFEGLEDVSIVAAPGYSYRYSTNPDNVVATHNALINHCEKMRYRVAVLDTPPHQLVSDSLAFRNKRSSKYAAIYYPWITVADPLGDGRLNLPPSGFVAGIYARNDIEHAVFKAPANEVVRLAIDFEQRLNKAQQEVLNPDGVNCFRFFEGRGYLLWGARTISDDPEWKYVSLRRYFAYLEHSIDRGTQWVVFENNSKQLWDNVRRTVEDFLYNEWKMGGLMGSKPEEAYFVRCDLSTMTQNDLDNGRLVCLIGVSPVRPAEFVIFRIGQWTATSNR